MATREKILEWMREIWAQENKRIFSGRLSRPRFRIAVDPSWSGLCETDPEWKTDRISINPRYVKTKKHLHRVMVHEMIHQLQAIQKSARTRAEHHGRFFRSQCMRILCEFSIECYAPG